MPVESLEKYLKSKLFDNVDHKLFRQLNDFIFHQKSLSQIIDEYRNSNDSATDNNGKKLYERIDTELRLRNKNRSEIVEMVVDYLIVNDADNISIIVDFLKSQLSQQ